MEQMVLKGIELDLSSICFTDHIDYDFPDMGNGVEFLFDVDEYFAKLAALKESYPQFELRPWCRDRSETGSYRTLQCTGAWIPV